MRSIWSILSIILLTVFIFWSFGSLMPSKNDKITAGKAEFSTEKALQHIKQISQKPHYVGSEAHEEVKNYLVEQLKNLGLEVETQEGFVLNAEDRTLDKPKNIIARLKGTGYGKSLVILSHYDSALVPSYGASDAGSGVATILESLRAFLETGVKPKNDVIVVFSDAEEISLDGARLFVNKHKWAKNAALVLNFEARGTSGPSNTILETNQGNANLVKAFAEADPKFPMASSLIYSVYKMLPNDTDSTVFREDGDIDSFFFAFIDNHYNYHTALDTFENLNKNSLKHQGSYLLPLLTYFANTDLSKLKSENDDVFFNFPIVHLIHYPFSWILPLAIIAIVIFIALLIYGIYKKTLIASFVFRGFIPFFISLILCGLLGFYGWQFVSWLYPQYAEIQQGFTYNGHSYIAVFVFLSLAILFKTYRNFCRKEEIASMYIVPLFFWLVINILIALYFEGAGFFIIPVYFGLISLFIMLRFRRPNVLAMSLLALPAIILFVPLIKFFPIALGLKMIVISCVFTVLVFILLLPIIGFYRIKNILAAICFLLSIFFFLNAHFTSKFSEKTPKPNSLVYYENLDSQKSYWLTYDKKLDDWSRQYLGKKPENADSYFTEASFSKYGRKYTFAKPTDFKSEIKPFTVEVNKDSVFGNIREVTFTIKFNRKVSQLNLSSNTSKFKTLDFNGISTMKDSTKNYFANRNSQFLLRYIVSDNDSLQVKYSVEKSEDVSFSIQEYSFDLMTNAAFNIAERPKNRMPKPFVITDAIIVEKSFSVGKISEEKIMENFEEKKADKNLIINPNSHE